MFCSIILIRNLRDPKNPLFKNLTYQNGSKFALTPTMWVAIDINRTEFKILTTIKACKT